MKAKMTYHAMNDRKNRAEYIINTIGIGHAVASTPSRNDPTTLRTLTDTGLIIVTSIKTKKIITFFIASVKQGVAIYSEDKGTLAPKWLMRILHDNEEILAKQPAN